MAEIYTRNVSLPLAAGIVLANIIQAAVGLQNVGNFPTSLDSVNRVLFKLHRLMSLPSSVRRALQRASVNFCGRVCKYLRIPAKDNYRLDTPFRLEAPWKDGVKPAESLREGVSE